MGLVLSSYSQDHKHDHHNEIGVAHAPVYFVNEKEVAYGLHLHLVHYGHESNFGIGLGYERIFDEHKHNTMGIVFSYRPISRWTVNLAPGITFEDAEKDNINFALHLESAYEWSLGDFHIGPAFELAYDPEDYHISLGLHLGYGF